VGDRDEATEHAAKCGPTWRGTLGAVEWLTKTVAALPPRRAKTRR